MNETITLTIEESKAVMEVLYKLMPDATLAALVTTAIFRGRPETAETFFGAVAKMIEPFRDEKLPAEQPTGVLPFGPKGSQVN